MQICKCVASFSLTFSLSRGPCLSLQEGFWSWLSGVTDNSVYPVMFMSYLDIVIPNLDNGWRRYFILFVVSIALAYLNYR